MKDPIIEKKQLYPVFNTKAPCLTKSNFTIIMEPIHILSSFFFQNFQRFCYHNKAHIFLKSHGKFNSWKVFHLEDINENVPGYGNHN